MITLIKKFESFNPKTVLILHGLGGAPSNDKSIIFEKRGYDVIFPHIDYEKEWDKDMCKSMFNKLLNDSKNVDLIVGQSLGGYTAFLLSNILNVDTILINPALDRTKSKLKIKEFDLDFNIKHRNPNIEIYYGELDNLIPKEVTHQYLIDNNIKCKEYVINDMAHRSPAEDIYRILNISSFIK